MSDPVAVALSVAQILEERGLRYLVGGIGIADLLARAEAAAGRA